MSSPSQMSTDLSDKEHSNESMDSNDEATDVSERTITESASAIGVLADGTRFDVPDTMDVMHTLLMPKSWKSPATQAVIAICAATILTLYFHYSVAILPSWFFIVQFIFWRLGYNVGLGYMLYVQSNGGRFVKFYKEHVETNPTLCKLLERSVVFKDSTKYSISKFPDEFNAWMLYRFIVMVILASDLVAYFLCVIVYWERPEFGIMTVVKYLIGIGLIIFAVWSKADAHRVIGDYAWYWGDFFFLLDKSLVFDGIFQMFPHPMYSVGYAFIYGFSLMANSHTVFYVSLAGHLSQLAFLVLVESPHIDKTYSAMSQPSEEEKRREEILYDEESGYLDRKELVLFKNFDIYRTKDIILATFLVYTLVLAFLTNVSTTFHVAHYICWRLFHTVVLGYLLHKQSKSNAYVSHFRCPQTAFENWKKLYNTSLTMTNVTFVVCNIKMFVWTSPLIETDSTRVLTITLGLLLIAMQAYVTTGVYDAIGDFGFFYGDFFVEDVPAKLTYSGIYRYLNNPDSSLGFCGYYGVALLSGNIYALPLAILSHVCVKLFEQLVERPHMEAKYGRYVRSVGGLRSEMKKKSEQLKKSVSRKKQEYERAVAKLKMELEKRKKEYEAFKEKVSKTKEKTA